jgi:fucose permease
MKTQDAPGRTSTDSPIATQAPVAYLRLMVASTLGMTVFGAVQVVPAVSLEAIGTDLGLNLEHRGAVISLRMVGLVVSLLLVGYLGQRRGKQHFLFWGFLSIAGGKLLGAQSNGYSSMLGAMGITGLGLGVVEALINPLAAQLNPRHSARALNILNGLFSLGLVVGAFATGWLLDSGHSWRTAFLIWLLPCAVCAMLFLTPHYPRHREETEGASSGSSELRRFLGLPLFWVLFVAMVMGGGCEAGITSWAPNYMVKVLGASARGGALATIVYGSFMALGRFASGFLVTRVGPVRLMTSSAVCCGLTTVGLAGVQSPWAAWCLFALSGLFVACFWPTMLSVASDHISAASTWLFALLSAAGVLGCVIFPWVIGVLGDGFGLRSAVLVLPASMLVLLALMIPAARLVRRRRHRAEVA